MSYINFKYLRFEKVELFIDGYIKKMFLDHPASVDESYFQHFFYAIGYSVRLIAAGVACFIHAFIPGLFSFTASTMIKKIIAEVNQRYNTSSKQQEHK